METTEFNIEALPVEIKYIGEIASPWQKNAVVDLWQVTIGKLWGNKLGQWRIDYKTGTGLRKNGRIKKPAVQDVLHSLFSDAMAGNLSFNDWCDEYGYSNDSISALNTYKQCCDTAEKLRMYFDHETRKQIEQIIFE